MPRSTRPFRPLAAWIAIIGLAACPGQRGDPVCPVLCGTQCLPASACASGVLCPASAPCDPCSGQCRQPCAVKSDCSPDLDCCASAGSDVCLDTQGDLYHCGDCATSCGASADTCLSGACSCGKLGLSCGDNQLCCGDACIAIDQQNCGACGVSCDAVDGGGAFDFAGMDLTPAGATLIPIALSVDAIAIGGMGAPNGVLETGETAVVAPTWENAAVQLVTLTGVASGFDGPLVAMYTLVDPTSAYPVLGSGAVGNCGATSDCYAMSISTLIPRPAGHFDAGFVETLNGGANKTWTLHVGGSFADVTTSHPFYRSIETALHLGVSAGCGSGNFCPDVVINRAALSAFIALALVGPGGTVPASGSVGLLPYNCASGGTSLFNDVMLSDPTCPHIHYMDLRGIDTGCGSGMFCPSTTVNRAGLAVFVAKALVGLGNTVPIAYTDPTTSRHYDCSGGSSNMLSFTDVPATDPSCPYVYYLWARAVATGCGGNKYCPTKDSTRGEAADFVVRGFKLNLYGP